MNENYFMGLDGFVWFTGVVESRDDPAKLGRVQVRCLGYHTEDLNDIPSEDLPWAHVMMPVTDPAMQGLGTSPTFLTEGTWVVGFFRDANEKQQPVILGSLPGVPAYAADSSKGFNDPNGKYPGTISHSNHGLNESDVSRLARGEDGETHKLLIDRRTNIFKDMSVPIIANENIREFPMGLQYSNKRRDKLILQKEFPHISFNDVLSSSDEIWNNKRYETMDELNERKRKTLEFIKHRPEKNIALVTHSSFIMNFLFNFVDEDEDKELKHCYPYEIKMGDIDFETRKESSCEL